MSYLTPKIYVPASNITDWSLTLGTTPILILPAEPARIGFIMQNRSADEMWWGYDSNVRLDTPGYFCLDRSDIYKPPRNGIYQGAIYARMRASSVRIIIKSWTPPT